MDRLPIELLHNIIIQLSFEERLKCTLVCRYWYDILSKRSLLYDVDVWGDENFEKFINMLVRLHSRRSQVEKLFLDNYCESDKRVLLNLLPNLREFVFITDMEKIYSLNYSSLPLEPKNPNSKLECISDMAACELTKELLVFHSCTHLRSLKLHIDYIKKPREEIYNHLKNAPALKEVDLSFGNNTQKYASPRNSYLGIR